MAEPKIHCLNVKDGDCFILERSSGRVTMIDICCGNLAKTVKTESLYDIFRAQKPHGNYGMKDKPTNPVDYLLGKGITEIWRFILTHPDMDHMDGIENLFSNISVHNFWDCGIRRDPPDFKNGSKYKVEDWNFYANLVNGKYDGTKVIKPRAGDKNTFYNQGAENSDDKGDYIHIVAPTKELIALANNGGDINDASYVIVYHSCAGKVIFAGDSNDKTWEYILENHESMVKDAAVLFAPHHGRDSDRDCTFLDVVKPRVSFFGCAPSEHLHYSAYYNRDLLFFTNNQCGNIHLYPVDKQIQVFIENKKYATDFTQSNDYNTFEKDGYWFLGSV